MFTDFNFKLIVIEALLDKEPKFLPELTEFVNTYTDQYEWYIDAEPITEIVTYLQALTIEKSDLEKIDSLLFDGGNEIYGMIKPDWEGEDDLFNVTSVEGFVHLPNLKTVDYVAMCDLNVLEPMKQAGIEIIV